MNDSQIVLTIAYNAIVRVRIRVSIYVCLCVRKEASRQQVCRPSSSLVIPVHGSDVVVDSVVVVAVVVMPLLKSVRARVVAVQSDCLRPVESLFASR